MGVKYQRKSVLCYVNGSYHKVANPYGLSVRTTEFYLFHSLTAVGPKSYGYEVILRV